MSWRVRAWKLYNLFRHIIGWFKRRCPHKHEVYPLGYDVFSDVREPETAGSLDVVRRNVEETGSPLPPLTPEQREQARRMRRMVAREVPVPRDMPVDQMIQIQYEMAHAEHVEMVDETEVNIKNTEPPEGPSAFIGREWAVPDEILEEE